MSENIRIESELEVRSFLKDLRYALDNGAKLHIEMDRGVDAGRDLRHTNRFTLASLFPDENPYEVLRSELYTLSVQEYMRTVKDTRFPKRGEMREFGRVYNGTDDVYIKVRVELLGDRGFGEHTAFVMSFHFAIKPLSEERFPYRK